MLDKCVTVEKPSVSTEGGVAFILFGNSSSKEPVSDGDLETRRRAKEDYKKRKQGQENKHALYRAHFPLIDRNSLHTCRELVGFWGWWHVCVLGELSCRATEVRRV